MFEGRVIKLAVIIALCFLVEFVVARYSADNSSSLQFSALEISTAPDNASEYRAFPPSINRIFGFSDIASSQDEQEAEEIVVEEPVEPAVTELDRQNAEVLLTYVGHVSKPRSVTAYFYAQPMLAQTALGSEPAGEVLVLVRDREQQLDNGTRVTLIAANDRSAAVKACEQTTAANGQDKDTNCKVMNYGIFNFDVAAL